MSHFWYTFRRKEPYTEGYQPEWCISTIYWGLSTRMVYLYYIRRVLDQNGVSSMIYSRDTPFCLGTTDMLEKHHSGWEPSTSCLRYTILVGSPQYHAWDTPFWLGTLDIMLEIHHSGWEPSISCLRYTILVRNSWYAWDTPFWLGALDMLEIHHSGWEPLISCLRYSILVGNSWYHAWDTPFWLGTLDIMLLLLLRRRTLDGDVYCCHEGGSLTLAPCLLAWQDEVRWPLVAEGWPLWGEGPGTLSPPWRIPRGRAPYRDDTLALSMMMRNDEVRNAALGHQMVLHFRLRLKALIGGPSPRPTACQGWRSSVCPPVIKNALAPHFI